MPALPTGWTLKDKSLVYTFKFQSFASAIAFMVEVSFFCEKMNHHPEWKNMYDKVSVVLTTHDADGVTDKDHDLAAHMNTVFKKCAHT